MKLKFLSPVLLFLFYLPIMTAASIYIYKQYIQTTENIHTMTYDNLVDSKRFLIQNYILHIENDLGDLAISKLSKSASLRMHYEGELRVLMTPEVAYLYMLYYEDSKKGTKLRYLLDTSIEEDERAHYGQKFDTDSQGWNKARSTRQSQLNTHEDLDNLWSSLVVPVIEDGIVVAAVGVDFTHEARDHIDRVVSPLKKLYFYISIIMIVMLIVAYVQFVMYYRTRKKGLIDPLTKAYNRQYLFDFIRRGDISSYQILMMDIDHFKQVNDTYGHDIGDIVLSSVCGRVSSLVRTEDAFIRYGGEEFILLLYKQTPQKCVEIAERILKVMRQSPIRANEHLIDITLSIGINPYPSHSKDVDGAIKVADEQLYIAKTNGRNRIEIFDIKNTKFHMLTKKINETKVALEESRIKCMYQPVYNMQTKKISHYEILVRMLDEDGKVHLPHEFLPSISHTQVYTDLTKAILEMAKTKLEEENVCLAINLDLQDLFNADIVEIILNILNKNPSFAKNLIFEILETEEITNFEELTKHINEIKATGARIALDDFGSGYANFSYLVHLGIDILKIDGSLIQNIDKNTKAKNIVQTIHTLAKKMDIDIIAEMIETKEELDIIKELDIGYVQGYLLGRPSFELVDDKSLFHI